MAGYWTIDCCNTRTKQQDGVNNLDLEYRAEADLTQHRSQKDDIRHIKPELIKMFH